MPLTRRKRKLSGSEEFNVVSGDNLTCGSSKSAGVNGEVTQKVKKGSKKSLSSSANPTKTDSDNNTAVVNPSGKLSTRDTEVNPQSDRDSDAKNVRKTSQNGRGRKKTKETVKKSNQEKVTLKNKSVSTKTKKNDKLKPEKGSLLNRNVGVNNEGTDSLCSDARSRKPRKQKGDLNVKNKSLSQDSESSDNEDDFIDVDAVFETGNTKPAKIAKLKTMKPTGVKTVRKFSSSSKSDCKKTTPISHSKPEKSSDKQRKSSAKRKSSEFERQPPSKVLRKTKASRAGESTSSKKNSVGSTSFHSNLLDEDDVATVLMHLEGQSVAIAGPSTMDSSAEDKSCSEEESDWEEVKDHPSLGPAKSQLPSGPIQIRLDVPDIMKKKRKKKSFDWKAYYNRLWNRFKKGLQIQLHKVHLVCLVAHGMYCIRLVYSPILRAQALSLVPQDMTGKRPRTCDILTLTKLTRVFVGLMVIDPDQRKSPITLGTLMRKFSSKVATEKELVLLFLAFLGALGFDTRLVISLHPLPLKAAVKSLKNKEKPKTEEKVTSDQETSSSKSETGKKDQTKNTDKTQSKYFKEEQNKKFKDRGKRTKKVTKDSTSSKSETESDRCRSKGRQSGTSSSDGQRSSRGLRTKNSQPRSHASKITAPPDCSDTESSWVDESEDSDHSSYSDEGKRRRTPKSRSKKTSGDKSKLKKTEKKEVVQLSSDEFEEVDTTYAKPYSLKKKYKGKAVSKKALSSDSEESLQDTMAEDSDLWVEVYLETERKWVCVDVIHNVVNKPETVEKRLKKSITYVVAFSSDGSVKDITPHYASQWLSHTHKQRVDSEWWDEALNPYRSQNHSREENEDLFLRVQLMKRPLPQVIGEYKNHPLYALTRHLLKFEAIYPETAVPLGYVKKEPVYARECVRTLHSRENWLKEGQVVKAGEVAYKMVKSRPKWNKPKANPDELDLELFGEWQTELYVPPPAKDGKVHKNEYGNIELFKPSMLPAGTVHLRIEGLKRVANKLNIDCVPAMVGWDHHSGHAHPILDGFVVCQEHEDILLSAWDEDQELQRQREIQRRHKRVFGNWRILVRGLLIRERLKKRFNLESPSDNKAPKAKQETGEKATDTTVSWPRNRQKKSKKKPDHEECPFEVEKL